MAVKTIADRWFLYQGVLLSDPGVTTDFQPPEGILHTQEHTGAFDANPQKTQTGHESATDLFFRLWCDRNYEALISTLHATPSTESIACWSIDGSAIGDWADAVTVQRTTFHQTTPEALNIEYDVTMQVRQRGLDHGKIIANLTERTTAGNTEGSSVDNGASSANGGYQYLQVTALNRDSGTSFTVTTRDSPDNAAWADLQAFTAITTDYADSDVDNGTAEGIAISGTIDRYLAMKWEYAGSPLGSQDNTCLVIVVRD